MPHPIRSLARLARARRPGRRRGSVLILVVALVVLLALIGTAYLSSTLTERYTSAQNLINTEADLQMQGLVASLNGLVAAGQSGSSRAPGQEMPTYDGTGTYTLDSTTQTLKPAATTPGVGQYAFPSPANAYLPYDSLDTDTFLANRVPAIDTSVSATTPLWGSVSWSPFPTSAGEYQIVSPLDASSAATGIAASLPAAYKPYVQCYPTSKVGADGQTYPGVVLYLSKWPSAFSNSTIYPHVSGCFTPTGFKPAVTPAVALATPADINVAPNASGDGIADGGFFPMPGGPIAGITYFGSYRVIDGNSAVNVSTAYTSANDFAATDGTTTMPNYGFFRSNVGLQQMLNTAAASAEIANVNYLRFNNANVATGHKFTPINDTATTERTDFAWYSIGDMLDSQLARRTGNVGYVYMDGTTKLQLASQGPAATAALAYRFSLQNLALGSSPIEQALYQDVTKKPSNTVPTTPYAAGDTATWLADQFTFDGGSAASNKLTNNMPLRPLLVGTSAVSNATPSRLGNATLPAAWTPNTPYKFGDWVTDRDPAGAASPQSFVCIQAHTSGASATTPERPGTNNGLNPTAVPFWAGTQETAVPGVSPGVPFSRQPIKTAINTAPFDQLWLGFCQVMCDSNGTVPPLAGGPPTATATKDLWRWLPPMRPTAVTAPAEQQMSMFRSVIRYPQPADTALRLTASQMVKVRAALAAVNAMDLRDSDDDVTSRRIILPAELAGQPTYDVEVFGTEAQPFIGAVYAHVDSATPTNDFLSIQLVNPYDHAIEIDPLAGWKLGTVNRSAMTASSPDLTMNDVTTAVTFTQAFVVPAKDPTTGRPGIAILQSGTPPTGYTPPTVTASLTPTPGSVTVTEITQLQTVLSGTTRGELYLMKPRLQKSGVTAPTVATSTPSSRTTTAGVLGNAYDEATATSIADLVPVDQVDLTNLEALATTQPGGVGDFHYRRGSDQYGSGVASPGLAGWHFVYPGPYIPPSAAAPYAAQLPQGFGSTITTGPATFPPKMDQLYGYGSATGGGAPDYTGTTDPTRPTYSTCPVVLNNTYMAGPNRLTQSTGGGMTNGSVPVAQPTPPQFPFGGFTRNGDMMQVPFIGAYRIRAISAATGLPTTPNTFREMNSVSEDSSLAEDVVDPAVTYGTAAVGTVPPTPSTNDASTATGTNKTNPTDPPKAKATDAAAPTTTQYTEQIGRFSPVGNPALGAGTPSTFDFLETDDAYIHWHYHWAKRLFDYFTVHAPGSDYLPDVDPTPTDPAISVATPAKYQPLTAPTPVANTSAGGVANAQVAGQSEDTTGVEGLININTAPWPVLAALPFVPAGTNNITYTRPTAPGTLGTASLGADAAHPDDRTKLGQAIVDDRNVNGPYKSILDLYRVQAFRLENDTLIAPAGTYAEPGATQGLFSPAGTGVGTTPTGRPRYDFQDRFLLLNRISNLITTRSDTFTAYVLLQGYRNVGVAGVTPTLVVQRRAAYLLDRNGVTPANRLPSRYTVSNN